MSARAVVTAPLPGQRVLITALGAQEGERRLQVGQVHVVLEADHIRGHPGSTYVALEGDWPALVSGCGDRWLVDPLSMPSWSAVATTLPERPHCEIHVALPEPCPWCSTVEQSQ